MGRHRHPLPQGTTRRTHRKEHKPYGMAGREGVGTDCRKLTTAALRAHLRGRRPHLLRLNNRQGEHEDGFRKICAGRRTAKGRTTDVQRPRPERVQPLPRGRPYRPSHALARYGAEHHALRMGEHKRAARRQGRHIQRQRGGEGRRQDNSIVAPESEGERPHTAARQGLEISS